MRQINATDWQIDRLVYALYGLTEEIAIVEGMGTPCGAGWQPARDAAWGAGLLVVKTVCGNPIVATGLVPVGGTHQGAATECPRIGLTFPRRRHPPGGPLRNVRVLG
jgi:hypothetical protein